MFIRVSAFVRACSWNAEPTAIRELKFDFALEEVEGGALLIFSSIDETIANDYWYDSVSTAIGSARKRFGIPPDLWRSD